MARRTATWYRRDGWFRLVPPGGDRGAEYWFRELDGLRAFAEACGWTLREGR
jgi:hypothetical protein